MTAKWIVTVGATAILTLGFGTGIAAAQSDDSSPFVAVTSIPNDNDQMQDNTDEQCDAAHAEYQQMMTGDMAGGDMAGGQMMGGQMMGGDMMGGDMMGGATPRTSPSVPVEPSED